VTEDSGSALGVRRYNGETRSGALELPTASSNARGGSRRLARLATAIGSGPNLQIEK
jgi:hypothetical protein